MTRAIRTTANLVFAITLVALAVSSLTIAAPLRAQETGEQGQTAEQVAQQRGKFQQQMQDLWARGLTVSLTNGAAERALVYSNPGRRRRRSRTARTNDGCSA